MQRRFKIVLFVLIAVSVVSLLVVVAVSSLEMFIFTQELSMDGFRQISEDSYATNVTDGGIRVAGIYVRAEHPLPQSIHVPVLVSIWHSQDTELDSLFLEFTGTYFVDAFLEAPGGHPWSHMQFETTPDGKGTFFQVADLGFQGTGTVTLRFLLEAFNEANSFHFEAKFSMHRPAFIQLTRQEALAYTEIPILA